MQKLTVYLDIPADQYLAYYEGTVRNIQARSTDGRTVRFPAHHLRKFITPEGIRGLFELTIDGTNLREIRRISG